MSAFDEIDRRTAPAFDRLLAEPVILHPQVPAAAGGGYTTGGGTSAAPDPGRPVRAGLRAIVSQGSVVQGLSVQNPSMTQVANIQCAVDFDKTQFTDDNPAPLINKGDRIELVDRGRTVEVERKGNETTARVAYLCRYVKG